MILAPTLVLRRRETRLAALDRGVVVALDFPVASLATLETRGSEAELEDARAAESLVYEEAHACLDAERLDEDALTAAVVETWGRDGVAVAAGGRSYVVEVGTGLLEPRIPEVVGRAPVVCVVTDSTVEGLHGHRVLGPIGALGRPAATYVMEPGERSKTLDSVVGVWGRAAEAGLDRGSVVLGFGGGVVTDTAGFAAATWMRGVRWVALPTTLLAMVDASVGGKTGVDLREAKNAVGAFWQPSAVVCDMDTLRTEPARGFSSALAEVIKTALIGDPDLLDLVEGSVGRIACREPEVLAEIVHRSVRVKARIVGLDEREGGLRAVLNLGHTIGHALETLGQYEALTHGEAVSLGLVAALRIGESRGATSSDLSARVIALLGRVGLPTDLSRWDLEAAARLVGHDKKRAGDRIRFVLARAPGEVGVEEIPLAELQGFVGRLG